MSKVTYLKGTQIVSEAEATENGVLRDGYRVQTRMNMIDSSPRAPARLHRPGFIDSEPADAAALEAARADRLKRLGDAWRNPPALDQAQIEKPTVPAVADGSDVYARRDARLRDAWKMGAA